MPLGIPAPLTQAQWRQRKDRGKWTYGKYLNWWNRQNPSYGPLDPIPERVVAQRAQAQAQSVLDPILSQVRQTYAQRGRDTSTSITGLTKALVGNLAPLIGQTADIYGLAKREQEQVNAGLVDMSRAAGIDTSNDVAAQLAQAGQQQSLPLAQGVNSLAAGIASAQNASGGATMSRLISDAATEGAYAAKQPGIASLAGIQNIASAQRELNRSQAEQLGQITAQLPEISTSIYQNMAEREYNKAVARRGFGIDQQQIQAGTDQAAAAAAAKVTAAQQQNQEQRSRVSTTLSAANGVLTNVFGEPLLGPDKQPIPYTPYRAPPAPQRPSTSNANRARVNKEWQSLYKDLSAKAVNLFGQGYTVGAGGKHVAVEPAGPKEKRLTPNSKAYRSLLAYARQQNALFLTPLPTAQLDRMIRAALYAAGYQKFGPEGKPKPKKKK